MPGDGEDLDVSSFEQDVLPAPAGITATTVSDTQITVAFNPVAGARKYFIWQATGGNPATFVGTVLDTGAASYSRTIIRLTPGTTYLYQISTVAADGSESPRSTPPVSATTLSVAPGAPTNVTASAVASPNFQVNVSWTAPVSPTPTKYFVFESVAGGAFNFKSTVVAPSVTYSATNLAPATQYCYQIVSSLQDGSQSGPSTPPACATTAAGPSAPNGVSATAISDTRVLVQWNGVASASKYFVYQSTTGSAGTFTQRGQSPASQLSFLDINLTANTSYCYKVSTVFANGTESAQSSPAQCVSTLATGAGGFQGYWKLDEQTGTSALDASGFSRTGSITAGTYQVVDRAPFEDNRSAVSFSASPISAITVPPAAGFNLLGNFTVAFWAKIPVAANVKFIGMRAAGCGALGWEIAQDGTGLHFSGQTTTINAGTSLPVGSWNHVAVSYAGGTLQIFVNGVATGSGAFLPDNTQTTSLSIGHVASCASGAVMLDDIQILSRAMPSNEIAALGASPADVVNLTVTAKTSVSIDLAWTPVPGATAYQVFRGTAAGNEVFLTHSPASSATYQSDHLAPGSQHSYVVRAVIGRLFSKLASNEVVDTTDAAPAAPTPVTAAALAADRIEVQWPAVTNGFKYLVYQSVNGGAFTFRGSVINATSLEVANLAPGTYTYEVQAEDAVQQQGPLSAPSAPVILTAGLADAQ